LTWHPVDWSGGHSTPAGSRGHLETPQAPKRRGGSRTHREKASARSGNQPAHLQGLSINFVFRMADKIKICRENTPFSTICKKTCHETGFFILKYFSSKLF
jgi:hypothetical protein